MHNTIGIGPSSASANKGRAWAIASLLVLAVAVPTCYYYLINQAEDTAAEVAAVVSEKMEQAWNAPSAPAVTESAAEQPRHSRTSPAYAPAAEAVETPQALVATEANPAEVYPHSLVVAQPVEPVVERPAQELSTGAPAVEPEPVFYESSAPAEFPGGEEALRTWIKEHLSVPYEGFKAEERGTVLVSFKVDAEGRIVAPKIKQGIGPHTDAEVLKLVSQMPAWTPAQQNGHTVPMSVMLPVTIQYKDMGVLLAQP